MLSPYGDIVKISRIVRVEPDARVGLSAAHLGEAAADHDISIGLHRGGEDDPWRVHEAGTVQARELVVGGINERRVHRAILIQAGEAETVRTIKRAKPAADVHR